MDERLNFDARIAVIEDFLGELIARSIPDRAALRDWTDRMADFTDAAARTREAEMPESVTAYIAASDAMLASVRRVHATLRADGHGGDAPTG